MNTRGSRLIKWVRTIRCSRNPSTISILVVGRTMKRSMNWSMKRMAPAEITLSLVIKGIPDLMVVD
jgi:hypothetical protein